MLVDEGSVQRVSTSHAYLTKFNTDAVALVLATTGPTQLHFLSDYDSSTAYSTEASIACTLSHIS